MSTVTDISHSPAPSTAHVQEVLRSAERELHELLHKRAEIMKRIGTIKQTLLYLAKTFGDEVLTPEVLPILGRGTPRKQPGFTRACRTVLMEAGIPLEARQGYRELARRFPELIERHKDPMASVTTVFNRLVGYAEVRSFLNGKGRRVWEWVAEPATASPAIMDLPSRPI
ncbi:MAG TPA: hypothetical protein VLT90_02570 [Terriglobales bacterium]|nr:hypothetical protein [Terriglobales bacterium]